ncbi:MAG: histidine phosphatase family protein [Chamaesiphon sp.]|nr:histidine phosphatase family protein [Chamaesiphon sp.]
MQTLWLVRHGHRLDFIQPEWFDTATYRYDPPLSAAGFDQANSLAQQLSQVQIDCIYTSPFLRTIQTAEPLARLLQLPIRLEWGLCEWLCQDWTAGFPETTPVDELIRYYPNIDDAYQSLVMPFYPETVQELDARITIIAGKLIQCNSKNILAIAHKGSVLGIAATLTGNDLWRTYDLGCGEIIELVWTEGRWLSSIIDGQAMPERR